MFVLHGRLPDRIDMIDGMSLDDNRTQFAVRRAAFAVCRHHASAWACSRVRMCRVCMHVSVYACAQLVVAVCTSVVCVGLWLSLLVAQAVYRLGWKKVEYIYTEREKSFVGLTIVFVILSLCGHLYRAVHGRRGSWMQLQLPFLTLTNSYIALLVHAFWPDDSASVAPVDGDDDRRRGYDDASYGDGKGGGLLDEEED